MTNEKLMEIAKEARENACVDISGFKVGAALLTRDGKVFKGCNIEDPSGIGVTNICAERCATIKAISEGSNDFEKIAVAGGLDELIFCAPCGACRQYLNSWCPGIKVVLQNNDGTLKEYSMSELLPYSFDEKF
ncbi:MAG: cytidine deaminase [Oscillospiraceae bacterium]|nr:cytidine deaminase [Oscillospiraceae bacterium]MCL2277868.1 cytidine deaminase [Oscillospiraceae bacterium]